MIETGELDLAVGGVCRSTGRGPETVERAAGVGLFGRRRSPECAGAITAVCTVVEALLLREPSYRNADRLVVVGGEL